MGALRRDVSHFVANSMVIWATIKYTYRRLPDVYVCAYAYFTRFCTFNFIWIGCCFSSQQLLSFPCGCLVNVSTVPPRSNLTVSLPGLRRRAEGIYSDAGTHVEHGGRLLAHGLARARTCRRHDHQATREKQSKSVAFEFECLSASRGIARVFDIGKEFTDCSMIITPLYA